MAELLWKHLKSVRESPLFLERPAHLDPDDVFADQEIKNTLTYVDRTGGIGEWAEEVVRLNLGREPQFFQFDLALWIRLMGNTPSDLRDEAIRDNRRRKAKKPLNRSFRTFDEVVETLKHDSPLVHFQTVVAIASVDRGLAPTVAYKLVAVAEDTSEFNTELRHPAHKALVELARQTQNWGALKVLWRSAVDPSQSPRIREVIAHGLWSAPYAATLRAQRKLLDAVTIQLRTMLEAIEMTEVEDHEPDFGSQHVTEIAHLLHPLQFRSSPPSVELTQFGRATFELVVTHLQAARQAGISPATSGALAGATTLLSRTDRRALSVHHVQRNS